MLHFVTRNTSIISHSKFKNINGSRLVLQMFFCPIHWSHVLSREWRCSWSMSAMLQLHLSDQYVYCLLRRAYIRGLVVCIAVVSYGQVLPISSIVTLLSLRQSYNCPCGGEETYYEYGYINDINNKELVNNQNKTKQNKTMGTFDGVYSINNSTTTYMWIAEWYCIN